MKIKCMVTERNASGDADFFIVKVKCTEEQYSLGEHYDAAEQSAYEYGYEPVLTFDENEAAGKLICDKFDWETAETIDMRYNKTAKLG